MSVLKACVASSVIITAPNPTANIETKAPCVRGRRPPIIFSCSSDSVRDIRPIVIIVRPVRSVILSSKPILRVFWGWLNLMVLSPSTYITGLYQEVFRIKWVIAWVCFSDVFRMLLQVRIPNRPYTLSVDVLHRLKPF